MLLVESPFAALRLRTNAPTRFTAVERATAGSWTMLMVVQTRCRRLIAPKLLATVSAGVRYGDEVQVTREEAA